MALSSQKKNAGGGGLRKILVLLVLVAVGVVGYFGFTEMRLPAPAAVELTSDKPAIGRATTFTVKAEEPVKGIESVSVLVDGAGLSQKQIATPTFVIGKDSYPELKPGQVTVTVAVQAKGTRLRTPDPVVVTKTYDVKLDPPALAPMSSFIHPAQGGAELVVYEVGTNSVRDGVEAGGWFFPGSPLPGGTGPTQKFVLFGVPYDLEVSEEEGKTKLLLVAEDELGNRAESRFAHKFIPRPMGRDVIELKESFMQKVTGEIYARTPELTKKGALLDDYLQLNNDLRKANMQELKELAKKSAQKFLWSTTFQPMQNAAVKGSFADRRKYLHEGKEVDTQDHLGFDLASVERAPVQASNSGNVVLAKYFGIFGNCVVIDHGYGLMTLYAHLSTMSVKEGQTVTQGQEIGKTGATGLAGGDHLHFTTVLHGLPVNPIEWWDGHWIQDRMKLKLGDALPWTGGK